MRWREHKTSRLSEPSTSGRKKICAPSFLVISRHTKLLCLNPSPESEKIVLIKLSQQQKLSTETKAKLVFLHFISSRIRNVSLGGRKISLLSLTSRTQNDFDSLAALRQLFLQSTFLRDFTSTSDRRFMVFCYKIFELLPEK